MHVQHYAEPFSGQEDISDKTETDYQVEQRINGFQATDAHR
jgi:hypothetical protein